ncbi:MAG: hypothetical protein LBT43_15880, partial [Prevotella sp.]|nr:hypothetical protein [Prevotella sp.]
MKAKVTTLLFLIFFSINILFAQEAMNSEILDSIQFKIEKRLGECFIKQNTVPLDELSQKMVIIKPQNSTIIYWQAYINYYKGIFYLKSKNV